MFLTIITFILVLSVLVFAHELGHFWTAKRFGVKAEEFGFGFPPRAFGVYKSNEGRWKFVWGANDVDDASDTVYSVNWLPLGGFVKIKGENGESEEMDSFAIKKIWQRFIILSAGVFMNVVLAAFLFSFGFMIGMPQSLDGASNKAIVRDQKIQIIQVMPNSPASLAGIKIGDVILEINKNKFINEKELQDFVGSNIGKKLEYRLRRGDEEVVLMVTPAYIKEIDRGGIGVGINETGIVKYPWYLAILEGIKSTIILLWLIIVAFYELLKNLILGNEVGADLAGPVGIASLTGQAARMGFAYVLQLAAMLSINLAVINFFPFPGLDGGRILFLIIEKVKGAPVKREVEALVHNIGMMLLMLLVLIVTFSDISKFSTGFKHLIEKIF